MLIAIVNYGLRLCRPNSWKRVEPVGDTVLLPDGSLAVVDLLDDLLFGDAEVSVVVVSGVVVFFEDFVVDFLVVVVPVPNVILSWIASIFDFESPLTFDKSSTLW